MPNTTAKLAPVVVARKRRRRRLLPLLAVLLILSLIHICLSIFHQTDNGLMVRMAIFCTIFGLDAKALKASYTVPKWHSAKPISRPKLHGAVRQAQDW